MNTIENTTKEKAIHVILYYLSRNHPVQRMIFRSYVWSVVVLSIITLLILVGGVIILIQKLLPTNNTILLVIMLVVYTIIILISCFRLSKIVLAWIESIVRQRAVQLLSNYSPEKWNELCNMVAADWVENFRLLLLQHRDPHNLEIMDDAYNVLTYIYNIGCPIFEQAFRKALCTIEADLQIEVGNIQDLKRELKSHHSN